jgi:hypothetical protein
MANLPNPRKEERLPFAEYVAVALVDIARQWDEGITSKPDELAGILLSRYKVAVDPQEISDALDILSECGLAYVANDPLAGTFVRISYNKYVDFFALVATDKTKYYKKLEEAGIDGFLLSRAEEVSTPAWDTLREFKVLQKYSEFGATYIEAAMARVGQADIGDRLSLGSDRLVSFADNLSIVEEIRGGLDRLEAEIKTNNEVGDALGDARIEAISEIGSLKATMAGNQSRAGYLLDLSRRVLGWIGRLVAKTSAEETVKHLLKLFYSWLT